MKKLYMRTVIGSSKAYPRRIMMLFWCLILGFISLLTKLKLSDLKAVKASINVSNVSCKSCTLLCYAKKNKSLQELSMLLSQKIVFSSLPNLGAQIRFAQIRYTAVQRDIK